MSIPVKTTCPHCGACYFVPANGLGLRSKCRDCRVMFTIEILDTFHKSRMVCTAQLAATIGHDSNSDSDDLIPLTVAQQDQ